MTEQEHGANSEVPSDKQQAREGVWVVRIIAASVAAFGLLVAVGSYVSDESPDWRKPLVVLVASGSFLGMWWLAAQMRRRSHSR